MSNLTPIQRDVVAANGTSFVLGVAGSGKSTALHHRLLRLLREGEPAYTILVLVAEAEDREPFLRFLQQNGIDPSAKLQVTTYTFLAREMVELFWPLVARPAGFQRPYQPPSYLHYDLAQLLMWKLITPMMAEGAFADLRLRPQQIVSQILDTLNRAALNQLSLEEARQRQIQTWAGDADGIRHLREAANAAERFNEHCRQNSLLDVSLTVRIFDTQLLQHSEFRRYFSERFRHVIVDNVEEQTPAGQHFIASLMDAVQTTTISYDVGGGYKGFLSADPAGAKEFQARCQHIFPFKEQFITNQSLTHFANAIQNYLRTEGEKKPSHLAHEAILEVVQGRYRHEMVQNAVTALKERVERDGLSPDDVALIAPGLDGALRHTLTEALQEAGLPFTLLQRRSTPRDEPRIRSWLTWLSLAHPEWGLAPSRYDVAEALALSIATLDPARAELLAQAIYDEAEGRLLPVSELTEHEAQRIGQEHVLLVEDIRRWLLEQAELPIDTFLHRLFEALLGQPPFQREPDVTGAAVSTWLIQLAGRLRQVAAQVTLHDEADVGRAFLTVINEGLVVADPPELGEPPEPHGVLIATVYGYLLSNRTSKIQVWLDVNSIIWWDIPRQPLSNGFVLRPDWPNDQAWTMAEEYRMRNTLLDGIVRGLTARCRSGLLLANSTLDRSGQRQDGPLWRAIQTVSQRTAALRNPTL